MTILRTLVLAVCLAPAAALAAPPPWSSAGGRAEEVASEPSMGDFVQGLHAEGLRGRALADAIRAEHLRRGHGPPEGKGWRREGHGPPADRGGDRADHRKGHPER